MAALGENNDMKTDTSRRFTLTSIPGWDAADSENDARFRICRFCCRGIRLKVGVSCIHGWLINYCNVLCNLDGCISGCVHRTTHRSPWSFLLHNSGVYQLWNPVNLLSRIIFYSFLRPMEAQSMLLSAISLDKCEWCFLRILFNTLIIQAIGIALWVILVIYFVGLAFTTPETCIKIIGKMFGMENYEIEDTTLLNSELF